MFGAFLERVGTGDLGETTELPDGRVVRRLGEPRVRELTTVFGRFAVTRCVYGTGERQVFALVPTDSRLQLPAGNVLYLLQEWDQLLEIDQAFSMARDTLNTILRIRQSVDTLEHGSRQMAESAPAFRAQQAAPDPAEEGELLIVTEDNKGVPMVRPPDAPPPGRTSRRDRRRTRRRWPASGRWTRWTGTCVCRRNSCRRCFATRTDRVSPRRKPRRNATGPACRARSRCVRPGVAARLRSRAA